MELQTFFSFFIPGAAFLLFALGDAFSDAYQLRDLRKSDWWEYYSQMDTDKARWHRWQALRQATVIALCAWAWQSWPSVLLLASLFWLGHDGIVNRVGLNRPFFYVGTTAALDRFFQRFPNPPLAQALAKFGLLAGSLVLLFFNL